MLYFYKPGVKVLWNCKGNIHPWKLSQGRLKQPSQSTKIQSKTKNPKSVRSYFYTFHVDAKCFNVAESSVHCPVSPLESQWGQACIAMYLKSAIQNWNWFFICMRTLTIQFSVPDWLEAFLILSTNTDVYLICAQPAHRWNSPLLQWNMVCCNLH